MAKGATWMVGLRMFNRGVGFVSTLILARLLVPAEFGLVAMGTALQALLIAISDFSIDVPLVQKQHIDRSHMDSAWSLQVVLGVSQAAILLALVQPAITFYGVPEVANVLYVLAGVCLVRGLRNIGIVMFQREMTFHKEFILMGGKRLCMLGVTLPFAFIWPSYWALLAGMAGGTIIECILSYAMQPYRPRWSRQRWGELIRFSRWLLANNTIKFVSNRGPDLVLGRLIGPQAVGIFSIGAEIGRLPGTELVAPINRVTLPGYSRLHETEAGFRQAYLDVAGMVALIAVPAAAGLAAAAPLLVPLLLGPKWLNAIPVVHYIALAGCIGVLLTNTGATVIAVGKPWLLTLLNVFRLTLLVPGIALGAVYAGISGVAQAYFAVACVMLFVNLGLLIRVLRLHVTEYLSAIGRPLAGAATMYGMLRGLIVPWLNESQSLSLLSAALIAVFLGAGIFMVATLALWGMAGFPAGAERRLLTIVRRGLGSRILSLKHRLKPSL